MVQQLFFDNYNATGDIVVLAVCFVMVLLVATSYISRNKSNMLFLTIIGYLILSAVTDIIMHDYYVHITDGNYTPVYILRVIYHVLLFSLFLVYIVYFVSELELEIKERIPVMTISSVIYLVVIFADIYTTYKGVGVKLSSSGTAASGINVFPFGYIAFILVIAYLLVFYRTRLFRNTIIGIAGTTIISVLVLLNQARHGQTSCTVASFLFPAIAVMYLLHSNPYGIKTGTMGLAMFTEAIRSYYSRKKEFYFVSVYMHDFKSEGALLPKELQSEFRQFPTRFFKQSILFKVGNGHLFLIIPASKNPDFEEKIIDAMNAFQDDYEKYHYDYKMIVGQSIDQISMRNEYLTFIKSVHRRMTYNTIYRVSEDDVLEFSRFESLIAAVEDINKKQDLNDERVLVYFQPVLNVKTGKYDTAEALMRLSLPDLGMVFPERFISIAEEYGYIHTLTKIIINKTCIAIKEMLDEGYDVCRISVNVSVPELRESNFTRELESIIGQNKIPKDKIAIEITESQSESDIMVISKLIDQLKKIGVKLYLDDFGTGYSNMERIMKLPFDIIKFDRSLVLASKANHRSEAIVGRLAKAFSDLDYSVLYEGVENDKDENMCINMSASYLQGYKYSRPIPVNILKEFFDKAV